MEHLFIWWSKRDFAFMNDLYPKYVGRNGFIAPKLPLLYALVKEQLISKLSKVKHVSPTLDIWTDRKMRAFMAITVRFWMTISKCKVTAWVLKGCTRDSIHNRFNSIFVQPAKKPRLLQYVCCSPNQKSAPQIWCFWVATWSYCLVTNDHFYHP